MTVPHYPLYIDGEWVDTAEHYEIRSPATDELVATVAKGGVGEVDAAVAAAKAAHAVGRLAQHAARRARRAARRPSPTRLGGRLEELAALQTRENGVTIRVTGALHIGLSIAQLQYLAGPGRGATSSRRPARPSGPVPAEGILRREPLGVVAAIVPWNIPLLVIVWKVAPALAAGNTVVLKPDEHAPLLALELIKEFEAAGLPKGVLNVVIGDGEPVGAHLGRTPRRAQGRLHRLHRGRQEHPRPARPTP